MPAGQRAITRCGAHCNLETVRVAAGHGEQVRVQFLGLGARRHAELLCEALPCAGVRGEGGDGRSRRGVRPHQRPQHRLVVGMIGEHRLGLGDRPRPVAGAEGGLDLDPPRGSDRRRHPLPRDEHPLSVFRREQLATHECQRCVGGGARGGESSVGVGGGRLTDAQLDLFDVEPHVAERIAG